ncbi:hypothetical protein BY996DRAFT_6972777 [Phakopsora pachyrhizi]|nr:hypothetical protein BY996DRAFT_8168684 [Phakopsora pachyrhizi]KAI8456431.1 hypothetical protein BY996DRAFT_6972777 [Phakopsora pachyrhizi]
MLLPLLNLRFFVFKVIHKLLALFSWNIISTLVNISSYININIFIFIIVVLFLFYVFFYCWYQSALNFLYLLFSLYTQKPN